MTAMTDKAVAFCKLVADNKLVSGICAPICTAVRRRITRPDFTVDYDELIQLIRRCVAEREDGSLQIVITNVQDGPDYNLVIHHGDNTVRLRIALVDTLTGENAGSFRAFQAVCGELVPEHYRLEELSVFAQVMTDRHGSVLYCVENGVIKGVHVQRGVVWP